MSNQIEFSSPHRKRLVALYTLGLLYPFMQSLLYSIGFPHSEDFFVALQPFWMTAMGGIVCGLFFQQPEERQKISVTMWLLVAATAWMFLRILGDRYLFYEHDPQHIWGRAIIAWFFYYPVGRLLTRQELRRTVGWIAGFWVASMVFLGVLGIVASVGRFLLYTRGDATNIGIQQDGRLAMGYYCVLTAQNLVLACSLALFLMFTFRKRWVWALCGVSLAVLFVAVGLTDGTNAMLTIGLLFGLAVFVLVTERVCPRTWKGIAIGAAAALAVFFLSYSLNTRVIGWLGASPTREIHLDNWQTSAQMVSVEHDALRGIRLSAPAVPEGADQPDEDLSHREIDATMHGRTQIWKRTLEALLTNEQNALLIGATPLGFQDLIQPRDFSYHVNVVHNMYLQVVLEWGLPGLVIMALFLALFAICAFRLLFGEGIPVWERFLPCMALAFLFSELADSFCDLNAVTVSLYLMFLFLGMTIGVDYHERNP